MSLVSLESKSAILLRCPPCKFSDIPTSVAYCRHVWLSPRMANLNMSCLSQTFRWSRGSLQRFSACPQPVDSSCSHVSGGCDQSGKEFMQLLCTTPLLCLSCKYVCSTISHYFHVHPEKQTDAIATEAASPPTCECCQSQRETCSGVHRCWCTEMSHLQKHGTLLPWKSWKMHTTRHKSVLHTFCNAAPLCPAGHLLIMHSNTC